MMKNYSIALTFAIMYMNSVHRSKGRIVEAIIDDFSALAGASTLSVIIQNTGAITADYSVIKKVL